MAPGVGGAAPGAPGGPIVLLALALALALWGAAAPARAAGETEPRMVHLAGIEDDSANRAVADMVRRAYQQLGIQAVSDFLPAERAVAALNAGLYDGDVFHVQGMERQYPNLVRVPVPIMHFEITAFALQPGLHVQRWPDLAGHSVCIRRGIKRIEQRTAGVAGLSAVYRVDRYQGIFAMLKLGRCDLAILPRSAWQEIRQAALVGMREAGPVLKTMDLYHYVHKTHAADVPALTAAFLQLRKDGLLSGAAPAPPPR